MCHISIIMPMYNKARYVGKAIESVQKQTYLQWELIIVDDGSEDCGYEVCKKYSDSDERIKLTRIANGGVSNARNVALDMAKGDYITFLDADDFVEPVFLEKLLKPGQDLIIGGLKKVSAHGDTVDCVVPGFEGVISIKQVADSFFREQINSGIFGFVASKMVKRSIIEKNKVRFDTSIRLAEDYDFFIKIYQQLNSICFVKHTDYCYLQEAENSAICAGDSKIDFVVQMQIQQRAKAFILEKGGWHGWEEKYFNDMIAGYIYTTLMYTDSRDKAVFMPVWNRLKGVSTFANGKASRFGNMVLHCYNLNWPKAARTLLCLRALSRK